MTRFQTRTKAGHFLAAQLKDFANRDDVVVLALPRGGVPVAYEVSRILNVPLDVLIVRKFVVPEPEELACGAAVAGRVDIFNEPFSSNLRLNEKKINQIIDQEQSELQRRERLYRRNRPPVDVKDRTAIVIDDGITTGATMFAALSVLKLQNPAQMIVAVPVAPVKVCETFERQFQARCVCGFKPDRFDCVGEFYRDFSPITDEQVCDLLKRSETAFGTQRFRAGN